MFDTCPVNCSVYCSVYCCTSFSSLDAAANDVTGVTEDDDAVANGLPQHRATTASASIHRINLPHPNFPVSFKSYLDLHRLIHLDSSPYILQSPNDHPGEKHEDPLIRLATPPVIHGWPVVVVVLVDDDDISDYILVMMNAVMVMVDAVMMMVDAVMVIGGCCDDGDDRCFNDGAISCEMDDGDVG